jgi:penicillin-binding protein 1A
MSDMKIKTKRLDSNINKPSLYKGDNLSYKNIATKSVSSSEAKSSKLVDSKLVPATFIAGYKLKKKQKTNARDSKRKAILSSLPKGRFRRFIYYLNPKNFFRFLFSREGLKFFLKLSALSFLSFVLLVLGAFIYFRKDISKLKPEEIVKRIQNSGVKYYDRTGTVMLWEQKFNKDRIVVESADIDEDIKKATVAMEDRNFYNHNGFDTKGILRAVIKSGGGKDAKGTSTITQQLVKNELLTNERTYTRKIKELILAIEVERVYNKDQILTLYLNSVNYGGTATGIETAVKRYFGNERTAKDVSIGESVFLASIPQYPTVYDPYNPYYEEDLLRERFQYGVSSLVEEKMITEEEAKTIDFNQVVASIQSRDLAIKGQYEEIKAPHFVLEVKRQLEELYGAENLENGGYEVITTIDWDLQQVADKAVADGIDDVERGNGNNAALVSTDVQTGQILAMVGSRDFNYPEFGEYNEALEPRQPGSSIKPFVYAKLFEKDNWGAGSTILDTKKVWVGLGGNGADYIPRNADDKFFGPYPVSLYRGVGA